MTSAISSSATLAFLVGTWAVWYIFRAYKLRQKMPPGPPGVPFLGNIHQIPVKSPWLRFAEFSKQYGPIVSFMAANQPVVVLNDHKTAFELLERRSSAYSHRSTFILASEILCGGSHIAFLAYHSLYRRMKRSASATFSPRATEQFRDLQQSEAIRLTSELLKTPTAWDQLLQKSISSSLLTAVYGWPRLTEDHDPVLGRIHENTAHIAHACVPGSSMVDMFPIINRLPLWMSKWKRDALAWHQRETDMFEGFYREVDKNMKEGNAHGSFTRSLIENKEVNDLSIKEASWLSGMIFSSGAETTISTIKNFLMIMLHHPDVMQKAQAELDKVVGRDRPPSFADKDRLPYVNAVIKEVLRWRPVGPLGIPRKLAEDDWYNGYLIPKNTIVISNIWAINRDPSIYKDPEAFLPERHLSEDGVTEISPPGMHSLGHSTFGFGRRSCIGMTFANQSLFIHIAFILWAFDVKKARDAVGKEICPSLTDIDDSGIAVQPVTFECELVERHSEVSTVVARSLL